MKKLELKEMEIVEGGRKKLSCDSALGLAGLCLCFTTGPAGWACAAAILLMCEA